MGSRGFVWVMAGILLIINNLYVSGKNSFIKTCNHTQNSPLVLSDENTFKKAYYVAKNGSNNNEGTYDEPFATMNYAYGLAEPGDIIYIMPGVYTENDGSWGFLLLDRNGTEDNPITLKSYELHKAVIDCGNLSDGKHNVAFVFGANYNIIDGFEIRGAFLNGISMYGNFNVVKNCYIHNNGNIGDPASTLGQDGIYEGAAQKRNIYEYNIVQYNGRMSARNSYDHGFYMGGDSGIIRFNLIKSNANFGIQIQTKSTSSAYRIYNNTIVRNQRAGIYFNYEIDSAYVYNNILFQNTGRGIYGPSGSGGDILIENNYFYGNSTGDYSLTAYTHMLFGNYLSAKDPLFVNSDTVYALSPNSPCIDKGKKTDCPYSGTAPDIGAFEYTSSEAKENSDPIIKDQTFMLKQESFGQGLIGQVIATPGDDGQKLNYEILSGNEAGNFIIDSQNGNISATSLDIFKQPSLSFALLIHVVDNGNPPKSKSAIILIKLIPSRLTVYVDPDNKQDVAQDGTLQHPFSSWNNVTWHTDYVYLQKKGTIANEQKITVGADRITLGSYGNGNKPVIQSKATDFLLQSIDKKNISVQDFVFEAPDAESCIYIFGSESDSIIISNNTFISTKQGVRAISPDFIKISYNEFNGCSEAVYTHAAKCSIHHNLFTENTIAINSQGNSASVDIFHNVFYDNETSIFNTYANLTLYNNIFYFLKDIEKAYNSQTESLLSDYNLFYPSQKGFVRISNMDYNSLDELRQKIKLEQHSISANPKFVDAINSNFTLEKGSPAINAGINISIDKDVYGNSVPFAGIPDIGIAETNYSDNHVTTSYGEDFSYINENRINIFPNPSNGIFNIMIDNISDINGIKYSIIDIVGKTVHKSNIGSATESQQQIDLSYLRKGLYILVIECFSTSISKKIIIE